MDALRRAGIALFAVVMLGAAANGAPIYVIRAYWNPWVRFVFAGPLIMALGGLISLTDRRLRFAVTAKVRATLAPAAAE